MYFLNTKDAILFIGTTIVWNLRLYLEKMGEKIENKEMFCKFLCFPVTSIRYAAITNKKKHYKLLK